MERFAAEDPCKLVHRLQSDARGPRSPASPSPGLAESNPKKRLSFLLHAEVRCTGLPTACWHLFAHEQ